MSVRLFVLGLINWKDMHGYEIKATAKLWGIERWARIQEGSIYHALGQLKKEGLIEERPVQISNNNRPRYVYCCTEAGKIAFLELLRETCRSAPTESRDIDFGLAFIDSLPPDERAPLLKIRLEKLHRDQANLVEGFEGLGQYPNLHPWVRLGMSHTGARLEAEIEWMNSLLAIVTDWPQKK